MLYRLFLFGLLFATLISTRADASEIKVFSSKKLTLITFEGVIVAGDEAKLQRALSSSLEAGQPLFVQLNSHGGDVDEAMAMGRLVRAFRASTMHKRCDSSCVLVFLGGVDRYTTRHLGENEDVSFGVHRPELADAYVAHPTNFTASMMKMLEDYTVEMTGDTDFYDLMMKYSFHDIHRLTLTEAQAIKVVNRIMP